MKNYPLFLPGSQPATFLFLFLSEQSVRCFFNCCVHLFLLLFLTQSKSLIDVLMILITTRCLTSMLDDLVSIPKVLMYRVMGQIKIRSCNFLLKTNV